MLSVKSNYNTIVSEKMCAKNVNKNYIHKYIYYKKNIHFKVAIAWFAYLI